MKQYKDFQGKTLDEAIREACAYFGVPREKLEIEIVNDAKTGIFGLVGAKKAEIRAARVQLGDTVSALIEETPPLPDGEARETPGEVKRPQGKRRTESVPENGDGDASVKSGGQARKSSGVKQPKNEGEAEQKPKASIGVTGEKQSASRQRRAQNSRKTPSDAGGISPSGQPAPETDAHGREDLPELDLEQYDKDALFDVVRSVVLKLVEPIVGPVPCSVEISGKRVRAVLDCGDASGLLVGRDGQTLSALQYLASRIITRRLGGSIRLHIDAGRYKERQDDKLRELALSLAARAKESGRSQATRPLSAYQRRIVHLALESDAAVITRSKGEGMQRRVVIHLKREDVGAADGHDDTEQPTDEQV